MTEQIYKSVVLYSANVYLEVIPAGSFAGTSGELIFPFDTARESFFHFRIGQMAGQTPDEADFEPITEVVFEEFPPTPDGQLDIHVVIGVDDDKSLYVRADFCVAGSDEVVGTTDPFGPFQLD